jgi:diguanylate cyclase (GGDEF)-like protein
MAGMRSFVLLVLLMLSAFAASPSRAAGTIPMPPCTGRAALQAETVPYGARAILFDCVKDQQRYGAGDFSVPLTFAPIALDVRDPRVLRLTSVWQDAASFRFAYADGAVEQVAFTSETASRYLKIGALFEIPIPHRDAALTGITITTRGTANLRGVVLGPAIVPAKESTRLTIRLVGLYAAFAGLSLALIVYNLALWAAMRHRFQLMYSGMVTAILAYAFTSSGYAMTVFPALANNDRLRLNYVLLTISGVVAMQFMRHFFEPGILPRWLRRTIDAVCAVALVSAFAFAWAAPTGIWILDRFYFSTMGALVALILPVLVYAWRNRSRHLTMFALAWSAPVAVSVLRMLHGFGFVPYSFWLDNGNIIALAIEALLSSFLITARLRELGRERDQAQEREILARRLANTDPLTGLLNRRAFLELAIGAPENRRLMLIDIDHFKGINDRFGHDTGDDVLRRVADAIQSCRPAGSLAVRLGGEEFALLIPLSAARECRPEMVLDRVRRRPMPQGARVTVSLGYADGAVASEEGWKRLYRLADAALYRAKADGRDRACRLTDFQLAA